MTAPPPADDSITDLLLAWGAGRSEALDELMPLLYEAMRRLAARQLAGEQAGHTLSPTALVNEAWLRLVDQGRVGIQDRGHFLAIVSRTMRRILVDHARRRMAGKRVAPAIHTFDLAGAASADEWAVTVIALEDALARLATIDDRMHRVVECRFFGGLTEEETAAILGVTARTVHRDWLKARSWLQLALESA